MKRKERLTNDPVNKGSLYQIQESHTKVPILNEGLRNDPDKRSL